MAQHGVSPDEFEFVLANAIIEETSESTGRPAVEGFAPDGRWLFCVFDEIDETYVLPITAYEIGEDS